MTLNQYVYYVVDGNGVVHTCYTLRDAVAAVCRALKATGEAHITKTLRR